MDFAFYRFAIKRSGHEGQKGKNLMPSGKSNDRIVMDINKLRIVNELDE
jgi:hypothetical protein